MTASEFIGRVKSSPFIVVSIKAPPEKALLTTYAVAKNVEKSLKQDDEGMISVDMSIGIYAPDGEMESILFGEKGYYE